MIGKLLALSRSGHGLLDLAMTGVAALLWLGRLPPWPVLAVALVTAAAGYTALYALNDLLGVRVDKAKFADGDINPGYGVEAGALRHPIAQGRLSLRAGVAWFAFWYALALAGAGWLNPVLVWVVLAAPLLETLYCLLLTVSWWRVVVSGLVKSLGPVAAVLVVVPRPDPGMLALMVLWLMAWEVGGQNVPADWNDVREDRRVGARTIPLCFGERVSARVVMLALLVCVGLSACLPLMSPLRLGWPWQAFNLAVGTFLLLWPAWRLWRQREGRLAARLFDRASLYPLAQLALVAVFVFAA